MSKIYREISDFIVIAVGSLIPLIAFILMIVGIVSFFTRPACAEYIGRISRNPFYGDSCSNPFSSCGNPFSATSPRNPFSPYGNPFSPYSVENPFGPGVRVYGDAAPDYPVDNYSDGAEDYYGLDDGYGEGGEE